MTTSDFHIKKANRRSAVERLEESKAHYVKTERVLDCKQEFEHSSTLQVSTRPQIDVLLRPPIKSFFNIPSLQSIHNVNHSENVNDSSAIKKNSYHHSSNIFDSRSQNKDFQVTNKKFCSRNYDYDMILQSEDDKRWKTTPNSPVCDGLTFLATKPSAKCENDSYRENLEDFPTNRYWEISTVPDRNSFTMDAENFSNHDESECEAFSTDEPDSLSTGDPMEFDDKYHDSKTSDYVSRSSSFKCLFPSDRVRNLVNRFECHFNKNSELSTPKLDTDEKRKSVSRSKSDVSHRFSKSFSLVQDKKFSNDTDLERFFNTMGLETTPWTNVTSPPRSPAHFFDSISSLNSNDQLSSICSEDSTGGGGTEIAKEGLRNQDLQKHAPNETSIIEKNARVVKWLYNCYNARKIAGS